MSSEFSERAGSDRTARKRVSSRIGNRSSRSVIVKEDDLTTARSKLDNLLDSIAKGEETFDDDYFDDETNGIVSPIKSKRSRVPRKARKRTREDEYSRSSIFILKLFDRTVDLSEFCNKYINTDPPLYPICRAWARSSDYNAEQDSADEDQSDANDLEATELETADKSNGLYILPPPDPLPIDEDGNEIDLRIPKRCTIEKELSVELIDESINFMADKSRESLLETNISRWRTIRQEWREASALNQQRYLSSFTILQALSTMPSQACDEEMLPTV